MTRRAAGWLAALIVAGCTPPVGEPAPGRVEGERAMGDWTRVRVVQRGGFAGTITAADIDVATLDAVGAARARALVGELEQLGDAPEGDGGIGADNRVRYEVELTGGGGEPRTLSVAEGARAPGSASARTTGAILAELRAVAAAR